MTAFLVQPLINEPSAAYTCYVSPIGPGWLVDDARDEEDAALTVHGVVRASSRRYAVQGPCGFVLIDLSSLDGRETLSLEPGPHR